MRFTLCSMLHALCTETLPPATWYQRTENRGQMTEEWSRKWEFGLRPGGKSEKLEDRYQVLFLLNQLIQHCQLINHTLPQPEVFFSAYPPGRRPLWPLWPLRAGGPIPTSELFYMLYALCPAPWALCPFCSQPVLFFLNAAKLFRCSFLFFNNMQIMIRVRLFVRG